MTPPIADPRGGGTPPPAAKPPFRGLKVFVAVDCVLLALFPVSVFSAPGPADTSLKIVFVGVVWVFGGALRWGLWRGAGAARAISWWFSLLTVPFVLIAPHSNREAPVGRLVGYATDAFKVFALVWLQLPGVKAHFRRAKSA